MRSIVLFLVLSCALTGCARALTPAYCAPDGEPRGDLCPGDGGYRPCSDGDGGWFHPCEDGGQ